MEGQHLMAVDTYATLYPLVAGQGFKAVDLNFIRTALANRATVVGATITLPATMADDEPIDLDDELFHDWLDAARTAVEALIAEAGYYKWDTSALEWVAWATIAELLTYVHGQWAAATRNSSGHDVDAWMPYDDPSTLNQFLIGYVNEIYYCLECLWIYEIAPSLGTADKTSKDGDGGAGGSAYSQTYGTTGAGVTQSGTTEHADLLAGSVTFSYGDDLGGYYITVVDDGAGGWIQTFGNTTLIGGSINYTSGAWSIETADAVGAGYPIGQAYTYDAATVATAFAEGWADFAAASYAGGSGPHGASATSHLYSTGAGGYVYHVEDVRVTGGHVTIPVLDYDLLYLFAPFRDANRSGGPSHALSCPEATGAITEMMTVGETRTGYLRIPCDWNNEVVHINYQYEDIDYAHWGAEAEHDWMVIMELRDPASYKYWAGSSFGGYTNGEYLPA